MASLNRKSKSKPVYTQEGAPAAANFSKYDQLRRSVMTCLLWEDSFYEDGQSIGDRIKQLAGEVKPEQLSELAISTREQHNLRHVSLLLARELARHGKGKIVSQTIERVICRADELAEFLALYWADGKAPLSKQVKTGLGLAFQKFDRYQIAKYSRGTTIKLRDVLFLAHPKPKDDEQAQLWKELADQTLSGAETWESRLSSGEAATAAFSDLMKRKKLGFMAALRNARNIHEAGIDKQVYRDYLLNHKGIAKVLPFRFLSAAKAVPAWESVFEEAMLKAMESLDKLPGRTVVIGDISGSMHSALSSKSTMSRMDASNAMIALMREVCEDITIYATAGNDCTRKHATTEIPARRGFSLMDAMCNARSVIGGGGIFLKQVMDYVEADNKGRHIDRVIVITDEQDCGVSNEDNPKNARLLGARNYMLNVSTEKNGIGYGSWLHIDGFSEQTARFIHSYEQEKLN